MITFVLYKDDNHQISLQSRFITIDYHLFWEMLQPKWKSCVYLSRMIQGRSNEVRTYFGHGSNAVKDVELKWLQQAIAGDANAFGNIIEIYHQPVYNLCFRMLGDHYEAEDAAQEAFFRAYKSLDRYDSKRSFSTWLLSISAHYCIDQLRKRRMKFVPLDALPYREIRDPSPNPEGSLRSSEDQQEVRGLLEILSPTDRAAVVMRYWYDFSYDEISNALNLSISAVKSRLHRARRTLAQSWSDKPYQSLNPERKYHESPAL
jgi:RNA polymerase sigma-70 factor (ECF subfamily)